MQAMAMRPVVNVKRQSEQLEIPASSTPRTPQVEGLPFPRYIRRISFGRRPGAGGISTGIVETKKLKP